MLDPKGCVILVPVASTVEPETQRCLGQLIDRGYVVRELRGCSQVDLARSALATEALTGAYGEFDEFMWIDSDTVFHPDDVDKLRSHGLPLTAGLYVKKGKPEFAGKFQRGGVIRFGPQGGLLEMEYVGFGFTHVRREVFETIERELCLPRCTGGYDPAKFIVPYFVPMIVKVGDTWEYLSEDYSFCHRAKLCGFTVQADTTIRLGHVGRKVYGWDDLIPKQNFDALDIEVGWQFPSDVRGWLTEEEGAGLAKLARGKDVLEVGSYCGRSTICMAQTAKSVVCVDPFDCRDTPGDGDTYEEFRENLTRYEVSARTIRSVFSDTNLTDKFDLVFIDGAHDEASVTTDAQRAAELLKPDGLLAFHDFQPMKGHPDLHPGVTATVNKLIAQGAELVEVIGTVAVVRPNKKGLPVNELQEIGRLHMEVSKLESDKATLLKVFAEVLTGQCDPKRILINLTEGSVQWSAEGTRPGMPAQMNGVPVCVMAPDEPSDDPPDNGRGVPPNGDGYPNRIKNLIEPRTE